MDELLRKTWDDVASCWDNYSTPLRPHPEDLQITREILLRWHARNPIAKPRIFLCGVTPEIAAMDWPFPIDLIAMDQAASMVQLVWPGDIAGVRKAIVGNWTKSQLPSASKDIIIGDGGFGFFQYPDAQRTLLHELHRLLHPNGLFIYRHYAQISTPRESVAQIMDAMRAGMIGNFHIFKWRVAMALQPDATTGVKQDNIWQAITESEIEKAPLPSQGWSADEIATLHFYRGKSSRLYFPTLEEFASLLGEKFDDIQVTCPAYELGERCPILSARPR
jgi:hypothetical protein